MHGLKGFKQTKEHIAKRLKNQSFWKKSRYWQGKHHSLITRKKMSNYWKKNAKRGEEHFNWKGGVTKEHNRLRNSMEYVLWRNEVWKRDKWTCRICKIKCLEGNIIAHHIKKFADFPELRFITENGLTLCRKCHIEIERPYIEHV